MVDEEMQKTMKFILQQRAQFAINMQKLDEKQLQAEARVTGVEERMTKIENVMLRLANVQVDPHDRLNGVEETMGKIAIVRAETSERLNILVNTVERYISERRNGSSI